jgi:hypothetical protein
MKRIFLISILLFIFCQNIFCQKQINIKSNSFIPYDVILVDNLNVRKDFNFYNKLFVKDGIFSKPIEIAYIGWHEPLTPNPAAGICYNTEYGNIIVLIKSNNQYWDEATYRRVLVHEMIHAYQNQVLNDIGLEHNDNFKRISKMINLKYHYNIQNN